MASEREKLALLLAPFDGGKLQVELNGWVYHTTITGINITVRGTIKVNLGPNVQASHPSETSIDRSIAPHLMRRGSIERPLDDHKTTIGPSVVVKWPGHGEKWTFHARAADQPEMII